MKLLFPRAIHGFTTDNSQTIRWLGGLRNGVGVVPIFNRYAGVVEGIGEEEWRKWQEHKKELRVLGTYDLPIRHVLVAVKGAVRENIQYIISHPQALAQCTPKIDWFSNAHSLIPASSTSQAVEYIVWNNNTSYAAICSQEMAEKNGSKLEILDDQFCPEDNTTTFWVFWIEGRFFGYGEEKNPDITLNQDTKILFLSGENSKIMEILLTLGQTGTEFRIYPLKSFEQKLCIICASKDVEEIKRMAWDFKMNVDILPHAT